MDPTAQDHLEGAKANEQFAQTFRESPKYGWGITVMFYAAVHYARAYLVAKHGLKVVRHDDMKLVWPRFSDLAAIRSSYDLLKQKSHGHRYYLAPGNAAEFDGCAKHLTKISSSLIPLIKTGNLSAKAVSLVDPT